MSHDTQTPLDDAIIEHLTARAARFGSELWNARADIADHVVREAKLPPGRPATVYRHELDHADVGMSRAAFGSDEPPDGNASRDTLGFRLYNDLSGGVYGLLWTLGRIAPGWRPSPDPLDYRHVIRATRGEDAVRVLAGAEPLITGRGESLGDILGELARLDAELEHAPAAGDWGVPGLRRAALVGAAVGAAQRAGMRAGYAEDPDGPRGYRTVAYIDLPVGQVSWHLPSGPRVPLPRYAAGWDGHTREEKAARIRQWVESGVSR